VLTLWVSEWMSGPESARELEFPSWDQCSSAKRLVTELPPGCRPKHKPRVPPAPGASTPKAVSEQVSENRVWELLGSASGRT